MSLLEIKKKKTQRDTRSLLHVIAPYDVIDTLHSDWQLINTPWRHWKP